MAKKTIFNMADGILTPCNVACGSGIVTVNSPNGSTLQCDTWLWVRIQWHVTRDNMTLNSPGGSTLQCGRWLWIGMTCHWIRPNVRHIGILHLVSISTTSLQSTCHSAPVSGILSKSDHPRQRKMTSCRFSRWWISATLDFRDPIMGLWKAQLHNFL